ncbi:MAG: hypothetical protein ACI4VL_03420 [Bacilli bacterium]
MKESLKLLKEKLLELDELIKEKTLLEQTYKNKKEEHELLLEEKDIIESKIKKLKEEKNNSINNISNFYNLINITLMQIFISYTVISYSFGYNALDETKSQIPSIIGLSGAFLSFITQPIMKKRISKIKNSNEYQILEEKIINLEKELSKKKIDIEIVSKVKDIINTKLEQKNKQVLIKENEVLTIINNNKNNNKEEIITKENYINKTKTRKI